MSDNNIIIALIVMFVAYGIAFFISMLWISFLPNVYHGFIDLKAEVVIGGIFQLAWKISNILALVGHCIALMTFHKTRYLFTAIIIMQFILFLSMMIFVG